MRSVKEIGVYLYFKGGGTVAQATHAATHSFPFVITATASPSVQLTKIFSNAPQLRLGGMILEAAFVGKRKHLVVYARRISNAKHIDATVYQLF